MTLRAVSRVVSGKYQCEVSADAPLFHTETSTAEMLVAELPAHKPILSVHGSPSSGSKKVIAIGEMLKANCVSGPSYPPVNFTWIINGNIFPVSKFHHSQHNKLIPWRAILILVFFFIFRIHSFILCMRNGHSVKQRGTALDQWHRREHLDGYQ